MSTLRLTFLGTGGGTPSISRGLPSISINFSGELILFDCGESTQRQMMKAGVGFKSKFTIFLTHLHGDHVLGIPGLLYTLSMLDRRDPIVIYGPRGVEEFVEMFKMTRYGKIQFKVEARRVREGLVHESRDYVVEAIRSNHTIESFCYMFREKDRIGKMNVEYLESIGLPRGPLWGKLQKGESVEWGGREIKPEEAVGPPRRGRRIVYTGDTTPDDKIVEFARDVDILIHDSTFDSSFEKEAAEQGHSTSIQAAEVAKRAHVKRLYLFHISPRYDRNPEKLLLEAIKIFPETYLAEDFLSYLVPYPV
ncbi:MAG: ribonuclease Z [Aigarchaeota archaeon]|nr:ribonuclease Z [Aigarchaeota archaeon]MCX8193375.1 ribonuclease Z [Nitrososphaeria archaeon]MDW7985905.1 ribonuclease Z [Nitrososphaerota archaeon]